MSVESKSSAVHEEKDPLLSSVAVETMSGHIARETADAAQPLPTTTQRQRTEQMYQLADIFASIFEALPEEWEHAIATTLEAA